MRGVERGQVRDRKKGMRLTKRSRELVPGIKCSISTKGMVS